MKIVLVGINAKYIHSNLAIRYLKAYANKYTETIETIEYSINNHFDFLMRELYKKKPDILAFSCYIWNIEIIKSIIIEYKKISPNTKIVLGGPEVSYDAQELLDFLPEVDIIVIGEGEATFLELLESIIENKKKLENIEGIVYRVGNLIIENEPRQAIPMDSIPFVYRDDLQKLENRIIYYETSRGCPFSCRYCLSSIEKGVRYRNLKLVYQELQYFLDKKVTQIKFVDRTFNCKKEHALSIWKYLYNNDNGHTNFHFEITAELLDEETLDLLSKVRPGLFQFEIGVQSTNIMTIDHIRRKTNFDRLSNVVRKIKANNNIHLHLDLIVGLPGEDYNSFEQSFNDVYALRSEQVQVGFLKILKGSGLEQDVKKFDILYQSRAPYEVLQTSMLRYDELLKLKMLEEMVEIYHNSTRFYYALQYIGLHYKSQFKKYEGLATYWVEKGHHLIKHTKVKLYSILLEFYKYTFGAEENFKYILMLDMHLQEKVKKFPGWYQRQQNFDEDIKKFYKQESNIEKHLPQLEGYTSKQISRMAHIEVFPVDIISWLKNKKSSIVKIDTPILFNYFNRNEMNNNAEFTKIDLKYNISQEM